MPEDGEEEVGVGENRRMDTMEQEADGKYPDIIDKTSRATSNHEYAQCPPQERQNQYIK